MAIPTFKCKKVRGGKALSDYKEEVMKRKILMLGAALALSSASAKTSLNIAWFYDSATEKAIFEKYVDRYRRINPNLEVKITYIPYGDLSQKLQQMVTDKTPPDVARVATANINDFKDVALDLAKYTDGNKFVSQFLKSQIPYVKRGDMVLGAPLDVTANGLFYNKDCFKEAGVSVPQTANAAWTWDKWREVMQTVQKKSHCQYGLTYDYSPFRYSTLVYQAGGRYFDNSGIKFDISNPENLAALEFFVGLFNDGIAAKGPWIGGEDPSNIFRLGQSAMYMSGNWNLSAMSQIKTFKWGVAPLPQGKIRSTVPGGKFVMGFRDSANPAEGAKFIQWLTSKYVNIPFSKDNHVLSARKDAKGVKYGEFDDEIAIYNDDLSETPEYVGRDWMNPFMSKISPIIREQVAKTIKGEQTSLQALKNIQLEAEKLIKK